MLELCARGLSGTVVRENEAQSVLQEEALSEVSKNITVALHTSVDL